MAGKPDKKQMIFALIPAGLFFAVGIPLVLIILPSLVDPLLSLPSLWLDGLNAVITIFLIVPGFSFSAWSVWAQFTIGERTPIPAMPPRRLVVDGPYNYCRNPMALGIIIFYLGMSIWTGSPSSIGLTSIFAAALIAYVKLVEEKELEARFGRQYLEYKKKTPSLIPRRRR